MENKFSELNEGIHLLRDKLVYVDLIEGLKTVKVFDLVTHNEKTFFYDVKVCSYFF